ncbi:MAG: hypothetical protein EXS27_06255 [Pedosphaera sp.]|nr:hypothetical protein [Pedosphaera sp.]
MNPAEVSAQVQELESLRSRLRLWRTAIPLVTVSVVAFGVFTIYDAARDLVVEGPPREEFVAAFTDGFKREVQPTVEKVAQQTFTETKRAVERELARLNDRTPEMVGALKKEVELLVNNIPLRGEKVLQASFGTMLKKREAAIRKMYPEATEQRVATLVLGLIDLSQQRLDHVTHQLFSPHLEALSGIMEDVSHIQRTEVVTAKEDLASGDMALLLFDLMRDEFAALHVDETDSSPTGKLPKKSKPAKTTKP